MPDGSEILSRGLETFAELGYDRTSARELARRLGVSHNFIHDKYGSKAAFWRAVVDAALSDLVSRLPPDDPDADPADHLHSVIGGFYRVNVDTPWIGRLCVDESSRESDRLDYLYERYIGPTMARIKPSVDALTEQGRMADVSMDLLFFAVISPVEAMVQLPLAHRLGRPSAPTHQERLATAEGLARLVVDGLLATGRK